MENKYLFKIIEEKWRKLWQASGIYRFEPCSKKPVFSVDTPPPYVSATNLHVGHAMSYTQADSVVRFKRMQGFNVFYPMGFDDNGLPTERYVEKKYNIDKGKISRTDFIKLCLAETAEGARNYRLTWESLGISVDWSLSYNTIGDLAQKVAQRSFIDLFQKGLIYRSKAPSFWCVKCGTALAQADLEDREESGKMYSIIFKAFSSDQKVVIATSRPEMLPACVSLYVNPEDIRYKKIIGSEFIVPIFNKKVNVRAHRDVDQEKGTGIMMVCTWGDGEDVKKWREDSLETVVLLDKHGKLADVAGEFQGLKIELAGKAIVERLEFIGALSGVENIVHVKNVHERCKTPVEFISSWQWSIKILEFKEMFLKLAEEIEWRPVFMKDLYDRWVRNLKWDWCISRDRYYGVPFPVWYCKDCGQVIFPDINSLPVDPREKCSIDLECPSCHGKKLEGENQVMDTWMVSSLTPFINAHWKEENDSSRDIMPMDLRVQGFEIIRTWLFYTMVKSNFHIGMKPWKTVMISGWGLDSKGRKMSKSEGNFVEISSAVGKFSADAVRWWSTGSSLGNDLRYVESDLQVGQKLVTKLWNAARLIEPLIKDVKRDSFEPLAFPDIWILSELTQLISECTDYLNACDFNKARIALEKFFWIKYCDNYLELCKDRIWSPEKYNAGKIDSLKQTMAYSFHIILHLFAPILPFVTEEIYHLLFEENENNSIHSSTWPKAELSPIKDIMLRNEMISKTGALLEIISVIRRFRVENKIPVSEKISSLIVISKDYFWKQSVEALAGLAKAKFMAFAESDNDVAGQVFETKGGIKICLSK